MSTRTGAAQANPGRLRWILLCTAIGGLFAGACTEQRTTAATRGADLPPTSLRTPTAAAQAYLTAVQQELQARKSGDRDAVARHESEQRSAMAVSEVAARFRRFSGISPRAVEQLTASMPARWSAMLAYYADGLDFSTLATDAAPATSAAVGARAVVRVAAAPAAKGKQELIWFRLQCVLGTDQCWRIADVDYGRAPAPTTSRAATSRASH